MLKYLVLNYLLNLSQLLTKKFKVCCTQF